MASHVLASSLKKQVALLSEENEKHAVACEELLEEKAALTQVNAQLQAQVSELRARLRAYEDPDEAPTLIESHVDEQGNIVQGTEEEGLRSPGRQVSSVPDPETDPG